MKQNIAKKDTYKNTSENINKNKIIELKDYSTKAYSKKPTLEEIRLYNTPELASCETAHEVKDILENITNDIVDIYYQMESNLLKNKTIPLDLGQKLLNRKAIGALCKTVLLIPEPDEITFPEDFINEYTTLLIKVNTAIISVNKTLVNLRLLDSANSLRRLYENNLLTLQMLRFHYISALGLPLEDSFVNNF